MICICFVTGIWFGGLFGDFVALIVFSIVSLTTFTFGLLLLELESFGGSS